MTENSTNNIMIDFFKNKQSLGLAWSSVGLISFLFLLFAGFYLDIELYILGIAAGLLYLYLILTSPKLWLYSIGLFSGIFFLASSKGVSVLDILFGAFYLGSITLWFIWQIFFLRKKVVKNLGDWFVLAFFFFLLFNFFIAYLNNCNLFLWMKEYLMFSIVLLYFPIRSVIKTESDLLKFLAFFALVVIGTGAYQTYMYYTRFTTEFIYAYELKHGLNINQTLYTCASIFGFIFTFHQTDRKKEFLLLMFTGLSVLSLIATFSRTFWLVLSVAIMVIFFIVPIKKKTKMLTYSMLILVLFSFIGFWLFQDKIQLLFQIIVSRFTSSAEGTQDASMLLRIKEWEQVIKKIFENPLGGNGLAKPFSFYNIIGNQTTFTDIIHNGYLFITYRSGIPTALLFFSFIIFYTIKAWDNLVSSSSNYLKALSLSNFSVMIVLYVVNFTSTQYFIRDGLFVTAYVISFIGINENLIMNKSKNLDISHD